MIKKIDSKIIKKCKEKWKQLKKQPSKKILTNVDKSKINKILKYAKTLVGIPYRWHRDTNKVSGNDKFWSKNGKSVTASDIKKKDKCIVCTGLLNLMRRYAGLSIPGLDGCMGKIGLQFPGTTGIWYYYLKKKGVLHKFDSRKKYPKGTMFIRKFFDVVKDQGHVVVLLTESKNRTKSILDEKIIHAYSDIDYITSEKKKIRNVGSTRIEKLRSSHNWIKWGYYTHVCYPQDWLLVE